MDDLAASFWEQVNQLLKTQRITQEDLAKNLDIPFGTYRGWNAYKRLPDVSSGYKIAEALDTTVDYLLTRKPPEGIPPIILDIAKKIVALPTKDREEIMLLVKHKLEHYSEIKAKAFYTSESQPTYNVSTREKVIAISRYTNDEIPIDS